MTGAESQWLTAEGALTSVKDRERSGTERPKAEPLYPPCRYFSKTKLNSPEVLDAQRHPLSCVPSPRLPACTTNVTRLPSHLQVQDRAQLPGGPQRTAPRPLLPAVTPFAQMFPPSACPLLRRSKTEPNSPVGLNAQRHASGRRAGPLGASSHKQQTSRNTVATAGGGGSSLAAGPSSTSIGSGMGGGRNRSAKRSPNGAVLNASVDTAMVASIRPKVLFPPIVEGGGDEGEASGCLCLSLFLAA